MPHNDNGTSLLLDASVPDVIELADTVVLDGADVIVLEGGSDVYEVDPVVCADAAAAAAESRRATQRLTLPARAMLKYCLAKVP